MITTDPIADLLTRIRNGLTVNKSMVKVPASKEKIKICEILVEEGYIKSSKVVEEEGHANIIVELKYGPKFEKIITNLQRVSKPGLRIYCKSNEIPQVLNGMGTVILSTNKGIMTGKQASAQKVGGEVLAYIY